MWFKYDRRRRKKREERGEKKCDSSSNGGTPLFFLLAAAAPQSPIRSTLRVAPALGLYGDSAKQKGGRRGWGWRRERTFERQRCSVRDRLREGGGKRGGKGMDRSCGKVRWRVCVGGNRKGGGGWGGGGTNAVHGRPSLARGHVGRGGRGGGGGRKIWGIEKCQQTA